MRKQMADLGRVLAELDADDADVMGDERDHLRAQVSATRSDTEARLHGAVASLEQIRLGLLRLHAGEEVVPAMTMAISAAHRLTQAIGRPLEGRGDVEALLAARATAP